MKIIYLRTSTQEQNPKNQLRDCKKLIKGDFEVVEEKQSAFKDKDRPLFEDIKKRISKKEITDLYCWDLDRLFRNRKKLIEFFDFCKYHNCRIHAFRQSWLEELNKIPRPFDEIMHSLMLQIMGWLNEEESQRKSMRVKIAYKNRKGNWGRKGLSPTTIKEVLRLHKKGLSIRDISDEVFYWDKHRNKKKVSVGAVHKIIKNNAL